MSQEDEDIDFYAVLELTPEEATGENLRRKCVKEKSQIVIIRVIILHKKKKIMYIYVLLYHPKYDMCLTPKISCLKA
jgi:hypothetical protein